MAHHHTSRCGRPHVCIHRTCHSSHAPRRCHAPRCPCRLLLARAEGKDSEYCDAHAEYGTSSITTFSWLGVDGLCPAEESELLLSSRAHRSMCISSLRLRASLRSKRCRPKCCNNLQLRVLTQSKRCMLFRCSSRRLQVKSVRGLYRRKLGAPVILRRRHQMQSLESSDISWPNSRCDSGPGV